MKITLPVAMFPLAAPAAKSGGLVVAVLIGLGLFLAAKSQPQPDSTRR